MSKRRLENEPLPTAVQLMRIVSLRQAAELAGVSSRTMQRTYPDRIIRISPGRLGMRVRDALMIAEGTKRDAS
jgi:predicted HTH domain antitoxin